MSEKPWEGRFTEKTDRVVEAFTSSHAVDRRLFAFDIEGSVAHCRMLARAEIITEEDASALIEGLGRIRRDIEHGQFDFSDSLEDIHMHIESRLLQDVGKVAQKLHTARSRNDQVALDARMYLRAETRQIIAQLRRLRRVMVELAAGHTGTVMPGYTHLQRAQPVLLAHHLMAYYEMFSRDQDRFSDALERIDVMPLGAAALAGTTYPIDRHYTAELLGFSRVADNSIDAVSDRDFILEFSASASIAMIHLSRLAEELVLWSSTEFGFIDLPDAFATGSSIMPQKKNPDVPELIRGKAGTVFGDLMALLTLMKGLPLAYNRDMQEDKAPLFRTVDTLQACLEITARMLPQLQVRSERMRQACTRGFLNATDLADYLVVRGVPFRKAHAFTGQAVAYALSQGKELHELSLDALRRFAPGIGEEVFELLSPEQMIARRRSYGGTATEQVEAAIARALECLAQEEGPEPS